MKRGTSSLQKALVIGGSVLVFVVAGIVLLGWAFGYYFLGQFHDNVAQDAARSIAAPLRAAGAQQLCEDEDAGYGPDNLQPWDEVYYRVPYGKAAQKAVFRAAAKAGYPLVVDSTVSQSSVHRSYASSPGSDGLIVQIWRGTQTLPDCDDYQYNDNAEPVSAYGKYAIYEIYLIAPARHPGLQ